MALLTETRTKAELDSEADAIIGGTKDTLDYPTSQLAAYLSNRFDRNERAKEDSGVKFKLLADLRQYEGKYDDETNERLARQGGTRIFDKLTMSKCDTLEAWINYVLEGLSENHVWDLESTPKPDLPPSKIQALKMQGVQMLQQQMEQSQQEGQQLSDMDMQNMLYDFAIKRSAEEQQIMRETSEGAVKNMRALMLDQQLEGGYRLALKDFINHFKVFKNAFMKGPFVKYGRKLTWGEDFQPEVKRVAVMSWESVSPFDMYPDPSAKTINEGDLFERARYNRNDLENMIGLSGYNDDAIRFILKEYATSAPPASASITNAATTSLDDERGLLENRSWYGYRNNAEAYIYEGVVFWGTISGTLLNGWEINETDKYKPYMTYEINAIMVGKTVIKAVLNPHPLGHRPYTTASFKPVPGGIWGTSLPEVLRDIQKSANSTLRALINNISISSGPQTIIDNALLPTGSQITNLQPWKIHQIDSRGNPNSRFPGISFVNVPSNAAELIGVLDRLEQQADEISQIPKFAHGATEGLGAAGSTATGMSIVQSNATKGMRNIIREITTRAIKPQIQMQFDWNMLNSRDASIKGDAQIKVNGPISMLEKEATQGKRLEFLQLTANPLDQQLIGLQRRANLLRKLTKGLDMPEDQIIKPAEMLAVEEQQGAQEAQKMQAAQAEAQKQLEVSQRVQDVVDVEKVQNDKESEQNKHYAVMLKIKADHPELQLSQAIQNIDGINSALEPEREREEMDRLQVYYPDLWQQRQDLLTEQMKASGALELEEIAKNQAPNQPGMQPELAGGVR